MPLIRVKNGYICLNIAVLDKYALNLFNEPYKAHKTIINTNIQIRKLIQQHKINFAKNEITKSHYKIISPNQKLENIILKSLIY